MAAQCHSFHFVSITPGHLRHQRIRRFHIHWASSPSSESRHQPPKLAKRKRRSGVADDDESSDGAQHTNLPPERSDAFAEHDAATPPPVHVVAEASPGLPTSSGGGSGGDITPPAVSLSLPWMLRLEDTSRRLEGEVRHLAGVVQTLQNTVDQTTKALQAAQAAAATTTRSGDRLISTTKKSGKQTARLLIDGTWLYYSLYEREPEFCPMARRFGRDWVLRYAVDWEQIPVIVENALFGNDDDRPSSSQVEIVSSTVFTSYRPETSPSSFRYKMFDGLKRAGYDVHMMETLGDAEKCVDIALAVELIHAECDVAILLTGDKDFLPAMARTRSPTKKLGLVSMRRSCNRALCEAPAGVILDYDVVWLDDYVEQFVVPIDQQTNGAWGGGTPVLSLFTVIKVLNDFIAKSPVGRVSSRDTGRYLKSLELDSSTTVSDEVKRGFGNLRHLVRMLPDVYKIGDVYPDAKEDRSFPFMIELVVDTASQRLQMEAQKAKLSATEKKFFDRYSLRALDDVQTAYGNTLQLVTRGINGIDDSSKETELSRPSTPDYSTWKVEQLKDLCRERNLPVTGVKAVLLERIIADDRERFSSARGQESLPYGRGGDSSPFAAPMSAPQDVSTYLQGLIVEYLTASGGQAGSRDVGRYLAVNKSSTGDPRVSALTELKAHFANIAQFIQIHSQVFQRDYPNVDSARGNFEFTITLVKGAGSGIRTR